MHVQTLKTLSGQIKIKIPTNLNEVTLGQMIAAQNFVEEDNEFHPLVPELTKQISDNIINIQQRYDVQERLLSLMHQLKYCYEDKKIPEYITIGTKQVKRLWWLKNVPNRIKVITNLSIEPAGAYLSSRDLIVDEINKHIAIYGEDEWQANFMPSLDTCAGILANYFYCPITGKLWNEQMAEDFKSEILKLSIQDTLPIARFFFHHWKELYKPKMSLWLRCKLIWNERQVYRNLRNSNL
ncbi:MAG: hypothetical protein P4L31_07340 [Candidatus Babeliales bacterium]|nr:hypothetical protein [Candidatus Babeliales bacterium]